MPLFTAGLLALASSGLFSKKKSDDTPAPMPEAPKVEDEAAKAAAAAREKRRGMARTKSIYTSPLGITGEAQVAKKTLLGY